MNVRHVKTQIKLFTLTLGFLACMVCLVGAVGAVTSLAGDTLRAIPALLMVPLYLVGRMLRSKIDEGCVDPLAAGASLAWLCGVTLGCIAWYAKVALLGA